MIGRLSVTKSFVMNQGILSDRTRDIVALLGLALAVIQTLVALIAIASSRLLKKRSNDSPEADKKQVGSFTAIVFKHLKLPDGDTRVPGCMALILLGSTFIIGFATSYGPRWLNLLGVVIVAIATVIQTLLVAAVIINTCNSVENDLSSITEKFIWSVLVCGFRLGVFFVSLYCFNAIKWREGWFFVVLVFQVPIAIVASFVFSLGSMAESVGHLYRMITESTATIE